jgi:hypothetical protein
MESRHFIHEFWFDESYCVAVFDAQSGALLELARNPEEPKEFSCPHEFEECVVELQRSLKKALEFLRERPAYS